MQRSHTFGVLIAGSVGVMLIGLLWTSGRTLSAQNAPTPLSEVVAPEHTVLLVHEVLNAFVSDGGMFAERGQQIDITGIMDPMVKLIAAARENDVRVAYVRWTTYPDYSNYRRPSGRPDPDAAVPTNEMHEGTWGWENPPEIAPGPFDWVLRKYRSDAFVATALDELLRWNEITTIVIVGVGAEVGVVPTLSTAEILGYATVAVEDAIRPTEEHRLADAMLYINDHARVVSHTDVIDAWNSH